MYDTYGFAPCPKCGGFGTIVRMGKCRTIAQLVAIAEKEPQRFSPLYHPEPERDTNSGGLQNA